MRDPFRIVVWGTGGVGRACIKQALKMAELDLVGVFVYSAEKDGKDVGHIIGWADQGIVATTDRDQIFALKPDCLLYAAMDFGDYRADTEIAELLRRGLNVITSLPYQNLEVRDPAVTTLLSNAAREGGSSFFSTGVNPGFIVERLALAATGATTDIKEILVEEFVRIGTEPEDTLKSFGFGLAASDVMEKSPAAAIAESYEAQFLYYLGKAFGTPLHSLNYRVVSKVVSTDTNAPTMTLKKDSVAYLAHRWDGVSNVAGPAIAFSTHWYMADEVKPADLPCEDYYRISIEGRPSIRMGVQLLATLENDSRTKPSDTSVPVFYVTSATMLQAVARVVDAPPGIETIQPPSNDYFKVDVRVD